MVRPREFNDLFVLINRLSKKPLTAKEISERYSINLRVVYRIMNNLDEMGFSVDRDFKGRFFLDISVIPEPLKMFNGILNKKVR